jgi:hypothetical protein
MLLTRFHACYFTVCHSSLEIHLYIYLEIYARKSDENRPDTRSQASILAIRNTIWDKQVFLSGGRCYDTLRYVGKEQAREYMESTIKRCIGKVCCHTFDTDVWVSEKQANGRLQLAARGVALGGPRQSVQRNIRAQHQAYEYYETWAHVVVGRVFGPESKRPSG